VGRRVLRGEGEALCGAVGECVGGGVVEAEALAVGVPPPPPPEGVGRVLRVAMEVRVAGEVGVAALAEGEERGAEGLGEAEARPRAAEGERRAEAVGLAPSAGEGETVPVRVPLLCAAPPPPGVDVARKTVGVAEALSEVVRVAASGGPLGVRVEEGVKVDAALPLPPPLYGVAVGLAVAASAGVSL
jgi:hypothetical protein